MYYTTHPHLHHPPHPPPPPLLTTIHRPTRYLDITPRATLHQLRGPRSIDVADALLDERPELRWQTDPAAYDRMVRERHERWDDRRRREYETLDAADLARQERYGSDPVNDDG